MCYYVAYLQILVEIDYHAKRNHACRVELKRQPVCVNKQQWGPLSILYRGGISSPRTSYLAQTMVKTALLLTWFCGVYVTCPVQGLRQLYHTTNDKNHASHSLRITYCCTASAPCPMNLRHAASSVEGLKIAHSKQYKAGPRGLRS